MRVAVLGAAGIIGRDIARRLAKSGSWDLLLADRRNEDVQALSAQLGREAAAVDVQDSVATARVLKGSDLVVNATWYYFNLDVMEAALRAGCDYLDLGGLYHTTRKQLGLASRFEREGRLAVLGCGKAPGITNVLSAFAASRFDGISSVRLRSGRRPLEDVRGFRLPYSPQTLIDEMTLPPVVLQGGHLKEIEPLSRRGTIRHPEPFGEIDYLTTLHSELATLPGFLGRGVKEMDFQVALAPDTVEALETMIRLGLASSKPVIVEGTKVVPRDFAVSILSSLPQAKGREAWITEVETRGSKDGEPRAVTVRVTGDETQNGTSIGAVAAANLIGHRQVKATGVHAPETALPGRDFISELDAAGLSVTELLVDERVVNG
jgi:lysine 6-dehydrogenase